MSFQCLKDQQPPLIQIYFIFIFSVILLECTLLLFTKLQCIFHLCFPQMVAIRERRAEKENTQLKRWVRVMPATERRWQGESEEEAGGNQKRWGDKEGKRGRSSKKLAVGGGDGRRFPSCLLFIRAFFNLIWRREGDKGETGAEDAIQGGWSKYSRQRRRRRKTKSQKNIIIIKK